MVFLAFLHTYDVTCLRNIYVKNVVKWIVGGGQLQLFGQFKSNILGKQSDEI